jgi:hypothetical protein
MHNPPPTYLSPRIAYMAVLLERSFVPRRLKDTDIPLPEFRRQARVQPRTLVLVQVIYLRAGDRIQVGVQAQLRLHGLHCGR